MECNKEEAIRAKDIAEKKMQNNDFEGARKIALKAQTLFPELENISQLLIVCDVHCSAQNKIGGSEKDWYGILQLERFADEATIKKQYRKLAFLLHPDKNKFPSAEAAFKLIGEANMLLSAPAKRYLYNSKCRVPVKTAATNPLSHHQYQNPYVSKQCGTQNNIPNIPNSQFGSLNHHRSTQPGLFSGPLSFWTCCPFCNMRYQYHRDFLNRPLRCPNCSRPYTAYDFGPQAVPSGQPKVSPLASNVGSKYNGGAQFSNMGNQQTFSNNKLCKEPVSRRESSKTMDSEKPKEGVEMPNADAEKPKEFTTFRSTSKKRGRKAESSESSDTASSAESEEDVLLEESSGDLAGQTLGPNSVNPTRRSSRQRQHVTYNESDDDEVTSLSKKSKGSKSSQNTIEERVEVMDNEVPRADNSRVFTADVDRDEIKMKESVVIDDCDTNLNSSSNPEPDSFDCPDSEFYDFDKDKEEKCFAVDQIWACYDSIDGMPRIYARIMKVFSPGFKLRITWVEPDAEDENEIDWFNKGLPVACGRFVRGRSSETGNRFTFSHQVHYEKKESGRYIYLIYPRKGETWALFRDWDIRWCNEQEKDTQFNFEIVEVISDFVEGVGVRVAYLDKVKGFESLFQRTTVKGFLTFLIPPNQLLRFSHRIPCFRMTGKERERVLEGSFELDPASLPSNLDELCSHGDAKIESEIPGSSVEKVKFMKGSEKMTPPKKRVDFEGMNDPETEVSKPRRSTRLSNSNRKNENHTDTSQGSFPESPKEKVKSTKVSEKMTTPKKKVKFEAEREVYQLRRSLRKSNSADKEEYHVDASQCSTRKQTSMDLDGIKDRKGDENGVSQSYEKSHSVLKDTSHSSFSKSPKKTLEDFYDFAGDKSEGKFRLGHIWAIYSNSDGLPKSYGQVQKIESLPFRLHVAFLEACAQPKNSVLPVCCGIFKLQSGKAKIVSPSSFSHVVKAQPTGKNRFKIYPSEGEIWALYKNWSGESTCLDPENCNYDIVEVLEDNGRCTKVLSLVRLNGFKSVFKSPRSQRSNTGILEIPRVEISRFSHQISAFQLTEEKDGRLRGCWELDPASVTGNLFCVN